MRIAVIGAGQVGRALAGAFTRAGHEVVFGVRDPAPGAPNERPITEAVRAADLALLAVPFEAAPDIVRDPAFAGKTVVDATNPLMMREGEGLSLSLGFTESGAERIAAAAPAANIVKAFNQTGFAVMGETSRLASRPLMLVAGDATEARTTVLRLATDVGFEAVDFGPLRQARLIEPMAMTWIDLAVSRGLGTGFAFTLTRERSA